MLLGMSFTVANSAVKDVQNHAVSVI